MPKEIYIDENGNERILSSSPSALSGLLDTDITTPSANQVLAYDGNKWGNSNALSTKADKSQINDLYVVGTTDYQLPSSITVPANGYKEIGTMFPIIPSGAIFLDACVPNNNGGYLFFQLGYYGNFYIVARNFSGNAVTLNANQIISVRYMYKPNLT